FATDQNTKCHCRIIMSPRDVAAGVNHHHKRGPDCEWRDYPRTRAANYRAANRQHEKECSDEFGNVLVHILKLLADRAWKKQAASAMRLWFYCCETTPNRSRSPSKATTNAMFAPILDDAEQANGICQATNLIQIKSRIIAPMIDMMKPAG